MPFDRRSLLDRLVDVCISVLIGALALYGAMWLLRAIWPDLLLVAGSLAGIVGLVTWWRTRQSGW